MSYCKRTDRIHAVQLNLLTTYLPLLDSCCWWLRSTAQSSSSRIHAHRRRHVARDISALLPTTSLRYVFSSLATSRSECRDQSVSPTGIHNELAWKDDSVSVNQCHESSKMSYLWCRMYPDPLETINAIRCRTSGNTVL